MKAERVLQKLGIFILVRVMIRKEFNFVSAKLKSGFTLIELLIAVGIIIIISGAGLVNYSRIRRRARDSRRQTDFEQIRGALEIYKADHGAYPPHAANETAECDSSRGVCAGGGCPAACGGTDWAASGVGGSELALLEDGGYIVDLPLDPKNDTDHYYIYEPDPAGGTGACGPSHANGPCLDYFLEVDLENGTTYRVTNP